MNFIALLHGGYGLMTKFEPIPSGCYVHYYQPHDYMFRKNDVIDILMSQINSRYKHMCYSPGFLCPNYLLTPYMYGQLDFIQMFSQKVSFGVYMYDGFNLIDWNNNLLVGNSLLREFTLNDLLIRLGYAYGFNVNLYLLSCRTTSLNQPIDYYTP